MAHIFNIPPDDPMDPGQPPPRGGDEPPAGGGTFQPTPEQRRLALRVTVVLVVILLLLGIFAGEVFFLLLGGFFALLLIIVGVALVATTMKGGGGGDGPSEGGDHHPGGPSHGHEAQAHPHAMAFGFPVGAFVQPADGAFFHLLPPDATLVCRNRLTASRDKDDGWYLDGLARWGRVVFSLPWLWDPTAIIDLSEEQVEWSFRVNPGAEGYEVDVLVQLEVLRSQEERMSVTAIRHLLTKVDRDPMVFVRERFKAAYQAALREAGVTSSEGHTPQHFSEVDAAALRLINGQLHDYGLHVTNVQTQAVRAAAAERKLERRLEVEGPVEAVARVLPEHQRGWAAIVPVGMAIADAIAGRGRRGKKSDEDEEEGEESPRPRRRR